MSLMGTRLRLRSSIEHVDELIIPITYAAVTGIFHRPHPAGQHGYVA
jgi:hypothetical protein